MAKKDGFSSVALYSGLLLMLLFLIAYSFIDIEWIAEVRSEVFGVGIALFVLGAGYKLFKVKLG